MLLPGWRDQGDVALRAAAVLLPVASSLMPPHAAPHRPDPAVVFGIRPGPHRPRLRQYLGSEFALQRLQSRAP